MGVQRDRFIDEARGRVICPLCSDAFAKQIPIYDPHTGTGDAEQHTVFITKPR